MKRLAFLVLLSVPARGGETCATQSFPAALPNWARTLTVPKHDPSLGALQSVTVTATCTLTGSVRTENVQPTLTLYTTKLAVLGQVRRPDTSPLVVNETFVESTVVLQAFDGSLDFAGGSGLTLSNLQFTREVHVVSQGAADLALFTATTSGEQITLGVDAITTSVAAGPGPLVVTFASSAAIQVSVCYGYREACQSFTLAPVALLGAPALPVVVTKHDPALGPLRAVRVRLRTTLSGAANVEHFDVQPILVQVDAQAAATLARPDASILGSVTAGQRFVDSLDAYDGTFDFGGTSGVRHQNLSSTAATSFVLDSPADRALFTAAAPGQTLALALVCTDASGFTATAPVIPQTLLSAGHAIDVCYDFAAPVTPYCFGDGSSATCPCGNASGIGAAEGCLHSSGSGGALRAAGFAEIGADTLVLEASHLPPGVPVLFAQGTAPASVAFGDGLRCVGGTVTRLGIVQSAGGAAAFPTPGTSVSIAGHATTGATLRYQAWYRNAVPFCTSSTFNQTNGLTVAW